MTATSDYFPTDAAGLTPARAPMVVDVADGEELTLTITPVAKKLGDDTVRMLAYNGSVPGPTLRVRQGTEIVVHAVNCGDLDATVHWHGLRLDNQYDGTTETQAPIPDRRPLQLPPQFPRPGHLLVPPAHSRGLRPGDGACRDDHRRTERLPATGPPPTARSRSSSTTCSSRTAASPRSAAPRPTFVAMGRFGNVLLANGDPQPPARRAARARSSAVTCSTPRTRASSTSASLVPG